MSCQQGPFKNGRKTSWGHGTQWFQMAKPARNRFTSDCLLWFHEFFKAIFSISVSGKLIKLHIQNLLNVANIIRISQFHEFFNLIFGWFLPFGPTVRRRRRRQRRKVAAMRCSLLLWILFFSTLSRTFPNGAEVDLEVESHSCYRSCCIIVHVTLIYQHHFNCACILD